MLWKALRDWSWFLHANRGRVRACNMDKVSVVGERPAPRNIRPELLTAIREVVSSAACNAKLSVFPKVVASASELEAKVAANCGVP